MTTVPPAGTRRPVVGHFDELAPDYEEQIPAHLRAYYLARKLEVFDRLFPVRGDRRVGLDVGCGLGHYARSVAERYGARIVAVDASRGLLRLSRARARRGDRVDYAAVDALTLPFPAATFDFAYAINVFHHLRGDEQRRGFTEMHRILKPGAPFLLFEINIRNPLFRFYMRRIFPRLRRIDRGDEEFIHPHRLPITPHFLLERVEYSTFTPDFLPRWALPGFRRVERALEKTRLGPYSIHYAAILRRT